MNRLHQRLKDQGFVVLSVNSGADDETVIKDYWKQGGFTFDTLLSRGDAALPSIYGVSAYPTNYLVGKDGKILWRGVGFDEEGLKASLKAAGMKLE